MRIASARRRRTWSSRPSRPGRTGLRPPSAFYFPGGLQFPRSPDLGLRAQARPGGGGRYDLTLRTERFAQSVRIEARGYQADDNYFHLEPGGERTVALSPVVMRTRRWPGP